MPFAGSKYIARSCAELDGLVDELDRAITRYTHAVAELTINMGTLEQLAYAIAKVNVESARVDAENAREALMKHRREHGC
jgi:hypothetical protein